MSPLIEIKPEERSPEWLTFDFREIPDVRAVIVFPAYGPNHHAGLDCWCHPTQSEGGPIVHNKPPH